MFRPCVATRVAEKNRFPVFSLSNTRCNLGNSWDFRGISWYFPRCDRKCCSLAPGIQFFAQLFWNSKILRAPGWPWILASWCIFTCCRGPWADGRLLLVWKILNKSLGLSHVPWQSVLQYLLGCLRWSSSISWLWELWRGDMPETEAMGRQTKPLGTVLLLWLLGGMGCSVNRSQWNRGLEGQVGWEWGVGRKKPEKCALWCEDWPKINLLGRN